MALKGFTFYLTYRDVARELSEKDAKAFYFAIISYMFDDVDLEETLPKNARIAFKCIKPNLKTSRSRSESGQNGNEIRWNKPIANSSQTHRKAIAKTSQYQVQVQDKDKGRDGFEPTAACPKCGGRLSPTGTHRGYGKDERLHVCESCGAEVWL